MAVFDALIGYDGAKAILRGALRRGDVNVLLKGEPESGKTVALTCIEEAIDGAEYRDSSAITETQLRDLLAENPPILLLDEIDDMDRDAYNALSTAMEQGRIQKDNANVQYDKEIDTQVIAGGNYRKVPDHIDSRFRVVPFDEYDVYEYLDVCEVLLQDAVEWVDSPRTAIDVGYVVWDVTGSRSVRKARDAAKLAFSVGAVPDIARALEDPTVDVESAPLTGDELDAISSRGGGKRVTKSSESENSVGEIPGWN